MMMNDQPHNNTFDCDVIDTALEHMNTDIGCSEAHGTLCGLLCTENMTEPQTWFQQMQINMDNNNLLQREAQHALGHLHAETLKQLNDPTCDFQLLLPNDNEDLENRVHALADWCQGFLIGLSIGGIHDFRKLPENAAEISQDLVEIARAGTRYELQGTENDENALENLIEYVRIGILLINEEMHPNKIVTVNTDNAIFH
ncbi:MAG: YecA family protein [Gammaproteobacteria bacterium]|nr:YecA family protein [Gammaproteobacteria bacterium]